MTPGLVLCHGCFDWLHLGHLHHLQEARAQGRRLIVTVTADRHVGKGGGRPIFTAPQRIQMLMGLACVDQVFESDFPNALAVLRRFEPAVYCKGPDYADGADKTLTLERHLVESWGGRLHFTKGLALHTTALLAQLCADVA